MKMTFQTIKNYLLPAVTAILALLLVLSYLFPNKVLDTYVMNLSTQSDTEQEITLPEGSVISYTMNTGKRPMRGIQPGIGIQGGVFTNGVLRYCVYKNGGFVPVSVNEYRLDQLSTAVRNALQALPEGADVSVVDMPQYVYLPFENYEDCKGEILITFTYISNGDKPQRMVEDGSGETPVPGLFINNVEKDGTVTQKDGAELQGSLIGYTVYTHNTYPLVYDLRILVFLFLAATAAAPLDRWRRGQKEGQKEGQRTGQGTAVQINEENKVQTEAKQEETP